MGHTTRCSLTYNRPELAVYAGQITSLYREFASDLTINNFQPKAVEVPGAQAPNMTLKRM